MWHQSVLKEEKAGLDRKWKEKEKWQAIYSLKSVSW